MSAAYRIPLGKFPLVARFTSQDTAANTPITEMMVNSLITSHRDGAEVKVGSPLGGIAWDGGYGIRTVEISSDGGKTWGSATLGADLGRYAFRTWSFPLQTKGKQTVMARKTPLEGFARADGPRQHRSCSFVRKVAVILRSGARTPVAGYRP
jgi:Mo-co oxidoreductase dimerisation domain